MPPLPSVFDCQGWAALPARSSSGKIFSHWEFMCYNCKMAAFWPGFDFRLRAFHSARHHLLIHPCTPPKKSATNGQGDSWSRIEASGKIHLCLILLTTRYFDLVDTMPAIWVKVSEDVGADSLTSEVVLPTHFFEAFW